LIQPLRDVLGIFRMPRLLKIAWMLASLQPRVAAGVAAQIQGSVPHAPFVEPDRIGQTDA
jgi:hypothetical protein